jgi:hypothetical protein
MGQIVDKFFKKNNIQSHSIKIPLNERINMYRNDKAGRNYINHHLITRTK